MPLPSAPFDPANSIFNGLSIIQLKIDGTSLVYEATQIDDDPEQDVKYLSRPDIKGVVRNVRGVQTKANEKWTFSLDEVKRLLEIFGGKLRGRVTATCTLWIPDVDDATGKCALQSQADFKCTVSRDGKVTFGNSDYSKTSIKIESNEPDDITWTKDAVIV